MNKLKSLYRRLRRKISTLLHHPSAGRFSELDIIHSFLRSTRRARGESVMIDVGAQFGESFTPFADDGWRILAYEPDPNPAKQTALAPMLGEKVSLSRVALSDAEREDVSFFTSEESTGISSLAAFRETHRDTAKVKVSTLTKELEAKNLDRVDFLKIDTEGFDYFVLKGFPWDRSGLKPGIILCEFEDSKTRPLGYDWKVMADFIQSKGYQVFVSEWFPIEKYGVSHRWRGVQRYPVELKDIRGWGNLIALASTENADKFEEIIKKYKPK